MHMDRRQFVKNLGLGTASLSMGSLVTASSCAPSGDSSLKQNVKEGEDGQFLFIDDEYLQGALLERVQFLESHREMDVVRSNGWYVRKNGKSLFILN